MDVLFLSLPAGMGFACLYQAAAVMTAKRCRTRLAFSNAIARSGMGLTFLIAPFTQLLIDFYGWQGERIFCLFKFSSIKRAFEDIWAGDEALFKN